MIADVKNRIPDLKTAVLCLATLIKAYKFSTEEPLFAEDTKYSLELINSMTTPLEKSHRELYEALERIVWANDHRSNIWDSKFVFNARTAIKNAEKIIK